MDEDASMEEVIRLSLLQSTDEEDDVKKAIRVSLQEQSAKRQRMDSGFPCAEQPLVCLQQRLTHLQYNYEEQQRIQVIDLTEDNYDNENKQYEERQASPCLLDEDEDEEVSFLFSFNTL